MGLPVAAQTPVVNELVNETFRDPTAFGWNVGNQSQQQPTDPCLTAGNATTPPNSIGACGGGTPDPSGSGALRLTPDVQDQATFAFYNYAIPSANGLQITFNFFSYGGTQELFGSRADGITFFLFNGATPNNQARPGAFGGSLGYAQKLGRENGLTNAYVELGLMSLAILPMIPKVVVVALVLQTTARVIRRQLPVENSIRSLLGGRVMGKRDIASSRI